MKRILFVWSLLMVLLLTLTECAVAKAYVTAKPRPKMMSGRGQKSRDWYARRYCRIQRQRQGISQHFIAPQRQGNQGE